MCKTTSGGESIRQVTGHQSRLILAVVCMASVMWVTSAQAQVTQTKEHQQDFPFSDVTPCSGENKIVSGQGHFHSQMTERSSGTTFEMTAKTHQNGKGATDGDTAQYQYNFSSSDRFRSSTPDYRMSFQQRKHIIRLGQGPKKDDYFVYEKVTFSTTSPPAREKVKIVCK